MAEAEVAEPGADEPEAMAEVEAAEPGADEPEAMAEVEATAEDGVTAVVGTAVLVCVAAAHIDMQVMARPVLLRLIRRSSPVRVFSIRRVAH